MPDILFTKCSMTPLELLWSIGSIIWILSNLLICIYMWIRSHWDTLVSFTSIISHLKSLKYVKAIYVFKFPQLFLSKINYSSIIDFVFSELWGSFLFCLWNTFLIWFSQHLLIIDLWDWQKPNRIPISLSGPGSFLKEVYSFCYSKL